MSDEQIIVLIEEELRIKSLGATEQYLEIHQPVYAKGKPVIVRIDREAQDGIIVAYLPVLEEQFYFSVYLDPIANVITGIGTEPQHQVYFHASSESLTARDLKDMCWLSPTESRDKGETKKFGKARYNYSFIKYSPHPEPDEFEDKLRKLLDFLEEDTAGIIRLVNEASGYIQVAMIMHNGNGMLSGPTIDKDALKRMAALGLSIDFDLYAEGNQFRESSTDS